MGKIFKKKHLRYVAMILAILQMASSPVGVYAYYVETENNTVSILEEAAMVGEIETEVFDGLTLESETIIDMETQESFVDESEIREYQELIESANEEETTFLSIEEITEDIGIEETEAIFEVTLDSELESEIETENETERDYGIYYGSLDLNNYLVRLERNRATTNGSDVTISTGTLLPYNNGTDYYTYVFNITSDGGSFTGHCSEPYKMAPRGTYPAYEITDPAIKYIITNLLLVSPDGPLWNTNLCRNLFFGGNEGNFNDGYLQVHFILGYLTGSPGHMTTAQIQWAQELVSTLIRLADDGTIDGYMNAIGDSRFNYIAYIAQTGELYQNIVWLEQASPKTGSLELRKDSLRPEMTEGNACYSLEGAVYNVFDLTTKEVLATITLDANGYGRADNLPEGQYGVAEVEAPKGYHINPKEDKITIKANEVTTLNVFDEPVDDPIAILLRKIDSRTNVPLAGAEFTIKYYDVQMATDPVQVGYTAKRTWIVKTDEQGRARLTTQFLVSGDSFYYNVFGAITIPLGTITIQETKAPNNFVINNEIFVRQIKQGEDPERVETYNAPTVPNTPFLGKVSLQKTDGRTNNIIEGAEFKIQEWNVMQNKYVDSSYHFTHNIVTKTYESNDLFYSIDNQGKFKIVETKAPNGYIGNWTQEFTITSNNQMFTYTAPNEPFNGKIEIKKIDEETGALLEGAEFKLYVWSESIGGAYRESGYTITYNSITGKYESETLYYTSDNLGKYKVVETKNPIGYFGNWEKEIVLTELNQLFEFTAENTIIRGDVEIIKFKASSSDSETYVGLEGVEFTFTDKETGEVVVKIITDENGFATTTNPAFPRGRLRYGTYMVTETVVPEGMKAIVPFEVTISEEGQVIQGIYKENIPYEAGIQLVKIDSETGKNIALAGTTFQILNNDKNIIEMTQYYPEFKILTEFKTNENGWCLLPEKLQSGTYYIRELQAPQDYLRGEDLRFVVEKDYSWENPLVIKIANTPTKGKVNITKVDAETRRKLEGAVFNLIAKEDIYTADGTLRIAQGEIVDTLTTDSNGYAQSKELYLGSYYAIEIEAPFAYGLNLNRQEFELIYENQETALVYTTIEIENFHSKIKTSASDTLTGGKESFEQEEITLVDIVSYENLVIGKEYVVKGFLMDKETNTPILVDNKEIISQVRFTPRTTSGTVEVIFQFKGSDIKGKTVVVFETLYQDNKEVYVHHDINDKKQTVEYKNPKIETQAKDKETGTNDGMIRESITIIDTVRYEDLIPGKEYVIKGILMNKETGKVFLDNGLEVTSEIKFIPEKASGEIDLEFVVNGNSLRGQTIVVFETLYYKELEIAVHKDIKDKAQTVTFPNPTIGTTAMDKEDGDKKLSYDKDVTIIDIVEYKGLTLNKEYTIKGILMDKATGEKLLINGREVVSEVTFIPETSNGTIEVEFTLNTANLAGKEIVIFETLYYEDFEIAIHADIDDIGQTVEVEKPVESPKTSDNNKIELFSGLIITMLIVSVLLLRRKKHGK